jgi:HD-GYP domain-containing protein (c-di-GMP phosphodiesterase class II)
MKLTNGHLFKSLFDNMFNGFAHCNAVYDEQGRLIDYLHVLANDAFMAKTGLPNPVGKLISELIPTIREDNHELMERYGRVSKGGTEEQFESYVPFLNRWFLVSVYCVEEGTFSVVFSDITEAKKTIKTLEDARDKVERAYEDTMDGLVRALNFRDANSEGHSRRVVDLTVRLAKAVGVSESELIFYRRGALLHDIGKMFVSDTVLKKPGKLDPEEVELMHQHALLAYEFLKPLKFVVSQVILDIPHYHHEQWNGKGYPDGLEGSEIPFSARLFSVVDVFDAMTTERAYRRAFSDSFVLTFITSMSGILFDPDVVIAFVNMMEGK